MKKLIAIAVLLLDLATMFGGVMAASVLADENCKDISNEYSEGPGEAFDNGMAREEPRLRFKDV
jgi:hypothetical protein